MKNYAYIFSKIQKNCRPQMHSDNTIRMFSCVCLLSVWPVRTLTLKSIDSET